MARNRTPEERAAFAAYMVQWRSKNRERAREISRAGGSKHRTANIERVRTGAVKHNAKIRAVVLSFFGGKCVRCGFDDPHALQMDHIHGGGGKERRTRGDSLSYRYRFVVEHPKEARKKYQLLCANCNCIKRWEEHEFGKRFVKEV